MKNVIVVLTLIAMFTSCEFRPQNKDAYLKRYESFISEVKENGKNYGKEKWDEMDEMYKKYTENWYYDFKEKLSLEEKVQVKKLAIKYAIYRGSDDLKKSIDQGLDALRGIGDDIINAVEVDTAGNKVKIEIEWNE